MMHVLRRHGTGWFAKVLLGLLVLSFGFWGVNDVFRGWHSDALATVGEQTITVNQFGQAFQNELRRVSRESGQPVTAEQARQAGLDRQILAQLVRDASLKDAAARMKLAMPDDIIARQIAKNPAFQNSRGEFDVDQFRSLLQQNGYSEASFLAEEKDGRIRQLIAEAVANSTKVPDVLVEAAWRQLHETRDARYFITTADPAKLAAPSDADIQKFYDEHPQEFTAPAYRSVAVILAEPSALAPAMAVTPDEVAAAYEKRKEEYGTPERRIVQQIAFPTEADAAAAAEKIKKGADFLAIAKERGFSEKDVTLGEVTRNTLPDEALASAAFGLKLNEVSAPVKGRLAVLLVRVTQITPGEQKALDAVKDDVEAKLKLDKAKDEILNIHDKVEEARAGGATFEEIAKEQNLQLLVIPAVDANGNGKDGKPTSPGLPAPVLQAVFESDVGVENDPVATPTDGFAWYDVREVTPSAVKALAEVKGAVIAAWQGNELRQSVLAAAKALAERGAKGETLEQLAASAKIETATGLTRDGAKDAFDAQALSALFSTAEKAIGFAPRSDGISAMVFEAGALSAPAYDPKSKEVADIRQALARSLSNDVFAMYLGNLQTAIGVNLNQALWSQANGAGNGG